MFEVLITPDEWFKTEHGRILVPILTLKSAWDSKYQIVLESRCYVLYKNSDKGFKQTAWIPWEVHAALKTLPPPK